MMLSEIGVLEHIVDRQQQDVVQNRVKMKQMAALLRIPRLHHRYIATNGTYDFIEKCEEVIAENDFVRGRKEALVERAAKRQQVTMERLSKQRQGISVSVMIPKAKMPTRG